MITDLQVQAAIAAVILPLVRADGSHIVRQTTLTADAAAAGTSVRLADLTGFTIGSPVRFDDALGEETLYVSLGYAGTNPVPLDFTNLGYSGLAHTHTSGTTVYTNLLDITPWDVAPMLGSGDPMIFVRVGRVPYRQQSMPNGMGGTFYAHIQYHRLLTPPNEESGQRMNQNNWAERQERATRADMATINAAILKPENQQLIGQHHPALAEQMSPLGSSGDRTILQFTQEAIDGDTWHLIATLDGIYAGVFERV